MQMLKQSTAATVLIGPLLDSAGAAVTTAVVGDFNLTKNGTTAALAAAATATHSHNGHYLIALIAGNADTLGRLVISANNALHAMTAFRFQVAEANVFDSLFGGGDLLQIDVSQFGNTAGTFAAGIPETKTASFAANAINAAAIADNAIDTATFAAGTILPRVTLVDTVTTYTGNTPQTGDSFARIGLLGAGLTAVDDATIAAIAALNNITTAQVRSELAVELARIDAAISTRSIYAGGAVASVTAAVVLPTIPTDWITANGIAADAVTKIQTGISSQKQDAY